MYGRANASLNAGYGYTGILIAFLARLQPAGDHADGRAAGRPRRRRRAAAAAAGTCPTPPIQVLQGLIFVAILTSETLYGRIRWFQPSGNTR